MADKPAAQKLQDLIDQRASAITALEKAIKTARSTNLRLWRELDKAIREAYRKGVPEKELIYVQAKRVQTACSRAEHAALVAIEYIQEDAFKRNRTAARRRYGAWSEPPKARAAKAGGR